MNGLHLNILNGHASFVKLNQVEFFSKIIQEMNQIDKSQGQMVPKDMLMGFRSLLVFVLSSLKEEVNKLLCLLCTLTIRL